MNLQYKTSWNNKLDELKTMHADIAVLCDGKQVAYIDIALHFNVGDHLIYAGTEAFIKEHKIDVVYRAFDRNVDIKAIEKCDIIMFHGGGNFGDLYPRHQRLRESMIQKFPNKRIIILPQTIHFSNDTEMKKSCDIFSRHTDLHMFLRDQKSLGIAKDFSKNSSLMPDMAHSLHPLIDASEVEPLEVSTPKILNLRRVDIEKVSAALDIQKKSFDWENMLTPWDHTYRKYITKLERFKFLTPRLVRSWKMHSDSLVFRAINYFNLHNTVYTDRLHGFILSYLLGKNIKLMDNSYGKNLNYFKQWINDTNLVEVITEK
ncbi:polysaccharide pyruvyl transferase family protein [Flavobacterium sp. W21_SRS_FM6]|uniref:polysaccharide pyruvyl transferase family protein n=1 Tax=Flavobacterium sp. W21_SRS_FM6 TaxID=3240268 RepID=UPI003F917EE5